MTYRNLPVAALLLALALAPIRVQAEECLTPLPADVAVPAQPASEGPGAFLGIWGNGKWQGVLCHTLVVESVAADGRATVVYSHGAHTPWNIRTPGFLRVSANIQGDTLAIAFPNNGPRAEYRLIDGRLHGRYITRSSESTVVLQRR